MSKNKYEFITDILRGNKLNLKQKEKLISLTTKELEKDSLTSEEISKRLEKLEKTIRVTNYTDNSILVKAEKEVDRTLSRSKLEPQPVKYLNPSGLYKYLFAFNQNHILKSTCHEIDSNEKEIINQYCKTESYNFTEHLKKILSEFEKHDNKFFAPGHTKELIRNYITGMGYNKKGFTPWSSDNIKVSWNNQDLKKWSKENPGLPPNSTIEELMKNETTGYESSTMDFKSNITGETIQNFREVVLHFKTLFHIRNDNSLNSILKYQNKKNKWNDKVEFVINETDFPLNIELFTDVDKLIQAYNELISLTISKHSNEKKPQVKLSFYQADNSVFLSIHHLNNIYGKTIIDTMERPGQTYANLIKLQLNGRCNFYLVTDFGKDGFAKINLWDNHKKVVQKDGLDNFQGGVEHLLQFPKN